MTCGECSRPFTPGSGPWRAAGARPLCPACDTQAWAVRMLQELPDEDARTWGRLSAWEQEFVGNVRERIDDGARLTPKQIAIVQRIHEKVEATW